jgi:hypothetical protein
VVAHEGIKNSPFILVGGSGLAFYFGGRGVGLLFILVGGSLFSWRKGYYKLIVGAQLE